MATAISNPQIEPEQLEILASHESYKIREAVAKNPSTPISTLVKLSESEGEVSAVYDALFLNVNYETMMKARHNKDDSSE